MEATNKTQKVIHQSYSIQYNDKAIANLKWNKKTEKKQRIRVHLKNGPRGVTIRWSPFKFPTERYLNVVKRGYIKIVIVIINI